MTVAATTATTTTTAATTTSSSSSSGLTSSQFLSLLVTELQNQNPLEPTNSTDFINQLTSYANFEQQQTLNSNMSTLVSSLNSLLTLNSSNYIGQTVDRESRHRHAAGRQGRVRLFAVDSAASSVTLTVKDSSGNTVWSGSGNDHRRHQQLHLGRNDDRRQTAHRRRTVHAERHGHRFHRQVGLRLHDRLRESDLDRQFDRHADAQDR